MGVEHTQGRAVIDRWDRVFSALAAEPRRQLIVALNDIPPENNVLLPEAAMSPTVPPQRDQITLELKHHHLPMLAEHGYVEWTETPFRASRGPNFDDVGIVFDALHDRAQLMPDRLVTGCKRLEEERRSN